MISSIYVRNLFCTAELVRPGDDLEEARGYLNVPRPGHDAMINNTFAKRWTNRHVGVTLQLSAIKYSMRTRVRLRAFRHVLARPKTSSTYPTGLLVFMDAGRNDARPVRVFVASPKNIHGQTCQNTPKADPTGTPTLHI